MLESHKTLAVQGNMDYSLFGDLNLLPRGYIDATFGNRIWVKGNLFFLLYVNIYFYRSLWRTEETWFIYSLFTKYEHFNASQALKEGLWLRKFLCKLTVAERRIITCYFVIIWVINSQSLYATWIHWRKELFSNHANCVGIHLLK